MGIARRIGAGLAVLALSSNLAFASMMAAAPGKSDPQGLKWKTRVIKIAASTSLTQSGANIKADSDVVGALDRSLKAWESVAGIEFQVETSDRQSVSASGISGDGINLVTVAQTAENIALFSKDPEADSAKTRVFYNGRGVITEADVVLNPFQQFSTDGTLGTYDLQSTLTHEIGHLLGLKHSDVVGSTMSASLSKNGAFATPDFAARTLSDSDIAAIRELYGTGQADDSCCTAISGKIAGIAAKEPRYIHVWAEDAVSGRVMANSEAAADGTFRIGGLPQADYRLFWQSMDEDGQMSGGSLGDSRTDESEVVTLTDKVLYHHSDASLDFIGLNGQVADTAISLAPGQAYIVYVGGKNLDDRNTSVKVDSPFFKVVPGTLFRHEQGQNGTLLSFAVFIADDAVPGLYTVSAVGRDGLAASLVGSIRVSRPTN